MFVLSLTVKLIREACHCEVKVPSVVQAPVNPRADFALVLRDVCFLQGLISFDPTLILLTDGGGTPNYATIPESRGIHVHHACCLMAQAWPLLAPERTSPFASLTLIV